jgi:hypothetical protein
MKIGMWVFSCEDRRCLDVQVSAPKGLKSNELHIILNEITKRIVDFSAKNPLSTIDLMTCKITFEEQK